MSFISRSLLLLCNLSFLYAGYVVFVTLYTRTDSCSLLYARVSCCLLYPRCTGFACDGFLVALFRFPRYTDLYLRCFKVRLTSGLWRSVSSFCESLRWVFSLSLYIYICVKHFGMANIKEKSTINFVVFCLYICPFLRVEQLDSSARIFLKLHIGGFFENVSKFKFH